MATFNDCSFSGNVGRDPEMRYFESGNCLATFSLPIEGRRDGETFWLNVKVWGKQATVIADYVKKGSRIIVNGELEFESWESNGEKKTKPVLNCRKFTLLGDKKKTDWTESDKPSQESSPVSRKPLLSQSPQPGNDDEEIPF